MTPTFINIGERTNVTGSAKFKKLIVEGNFTEALAVARQQVKAGSSTMRKWIVGLEIAAREDR